MAESYCKRHGGGTKWQAEHTLHYVFPQARAAAELPRLTVSSMWWEQAGSQNTPGTASSRLKRAKVRSRLAESSQNPSGEKASCVTVKVCASSCPTGAHVVVSHSQMAALLALCALQAEASSFP